MMTSRDFMHVFVWVFVCEGEWDSWQGALYLQQSLQVTEFQLRFIQGLSAGDHRAQSLLIWQTGG